MKMLSILTMALALTVLSGCAGLGFNKKATVMPDEISVSIDSNPQDNWKVEEVTGGLKWKLK